MHVVGEPVYKTERNLVRHFVQRLRQNAGPWGPVGISCEFEYGRGRADVLILADGDEHLIAIEKPSS